MRTVRVCMTLFYLFFYDKKLFVRAISRSIRWYVNPHPRLVEKYIFLVVLNCAFEVDQSAGA